MKPDPAAPAPELVAAGAAEARQAVLDCLDTLRAAGAGHADRRDGGARRRARASDRRRATAPGCRRDRG